jgi:hypothetical protein
MVTRQGIGKPSNPTPTLASQHAIAEPSDDNPLRRRLMARARNKRQKLVNSNQ